MSKNCTGKRGEDITLKVPPGTRAKDIDTGEVIGDLTRHGQRIIVAKGGFHGLGNTRFKSSVNRAPRQKTNGTPGEVRQLQLELMLLADVGLLGMPNAGKSTFIRSVSAAKPKVADYPFTTLVPNLGVVRPAAHHSFVIADIPGLIEGAAEGAGLGIQFLKHLERCRLLLHLVDLAPFDESDPVEQARVIIEELEKYSPKLAEKPRWLVINKVDLVLEEERQELVDDLVERLGWEGPVYQIAALEGRNTQQLCHDVVEYIDTLPSPHEEAQKAQEEEAVDFKWDTYHDEVLEEYQDEDDFDDDDDDDDGVEVIYQK